MTDAERLRPGLLSPALLQYLRQAGVRDTDVLRRLREETARQDFGGYQVLPETGQLIGFLIELLGARRTLDIGTFTGYSALIAALAVGPGGQVVTLDKNLEWPQIARRYWEESGAAERIEFRSGPAQTSLEAMIAQGMSGQFDFAFIDADKRSYETYFELCLELVRAGGVIALDNVLWRGAVADPESKDEKARLFRHLNEKILNDDRVSLVLLPTGDGVSVVRKRP